MFSFLRLFKTFQKILLNVANYRKVLRCTLRPFENTVQKKPSVFGCSLGSWLGCGGWWGGSPFRCRVHHASQTFPENIRDCISEKSSKDVKSANFSFIKIIIEYLTLQSLIPARPFYATSALAPQKNHLT